MKNYTSTVPVPQTLEQIEWLLADAGAASIHKHFDQGEVVAIEFVIKAEWETPVRIKLPVDADAVFQALKVKQKPRTGWTNTRLQKLQEQAKRTAWRLMEDWLRVQLSLISMRQASLGQIFLPYFFDGKESLYERFRANPDRMLPPKSDEAERPAVAGKVGT